MRAEHKEPRLRLRNEREREQGEVNSRLTEASGLIADHEVDYSVNIREKGTGREKDEELDNRAESERERGEE